MYGKSKRYEYQYNAPALDTKAFDALRNQKLKHLQAMIDYVNLTTSRMKFLCNFLGDKTSRSYLNCDNTNLPKYLVSPKEEYKKKLEEFRRAFFPILKVESNKSNIVNGVAASYYGVSSVGAAIHRSKYENGGDFPDFLLKLTLKAFRKHYGNEKLDYILYVPPTESGDLVKNFAEKLSRVLKIPVSHNLIKTGETKPQKLFNNTYGKKDNVHRKFDYKNSSEIAGKSLLLFDDVFDSGATIKEIGKMLTKYGARKIAPLVIAKTIGGR